MGTRPHCCKAALRRFMAARSVEAEGMVERMGEDWRGDVGGDAIFEIADLGCKLRGLSLVVNFRKRLEGGFNFEGCCLQLDGEWAGR